MKTIYKAVIVISAVFLILGCVGNNSSNTTAPSDDTPATSVQTQQAQEPQTTTTEPTKTTEPVTIATFSGSSTKDTETFTVPSDEWKISWDTKAGQFDGNFIFTINNADGTFKAAGANVIGTNSESTIVRGAGDYYLSITATQPYNITVSTV